MISFSESTTDILVHLDNEKAKVTDKLCDKYKILCIANSLVKGFKMYKNENNLSESVQAKMFANLLGDLLLNDTSISVYETVSRSTRRRKIVTEVEPEFGRHIDLIVKTKETEDQRRINASVDVLTHQQSKNLRINACMTNDLTLLFGHTNTRINYFARINYFDFSGRQAYISQLLNFEGCTVA